MSGRRRCPRSQFEVGEAGEHLGETERGEKGRSSSGRRAHGQLCRLSAVKVASGERRVALRSSNIKLSIIFIVILPPFVPRARYAQRPHKTAQVTPFVAHLAHPVDLHVAFTVSAHSSQIHKKMGSDDALQVANRAPVTPPASTSFP